MEPSEETSLKLLVVDDSVTVRMSLREQLAKRGCEVLFADDGSEILRLLRSEKVDVLMMGLMLPGGESGQDLLKEIRGDDKLASIPIALLTATPDHKEIAEYQEIGIDDVINKPWDEGELPVRLRTIARSKHAESTREGVDPAVGETPAVPDSGASPTESEAEPAVDEQDEERPRVLVVDDSMTVCMRLTEELQLGGMDAVATDRAQDALVRAQREEFDLAITDIVMPCMDGEELIGRLGALVPKLPCIVLTGSAEMPVVRRLAAAPNVVGILVKPWARERLMDTLNSALERPA